MPTELLAMVFEASFDLCDGDRSRSMTRIAFLETCSRWRALALETRVLWTSLFLATWAGPRLLEIIDEHLDRSGTLPLTATLLDGRKSSSPTLPGLSERLVYVLARTKCFNAGCISATLDDLQHCLSQPAPLLTRFVVIAEAAKPLVEVSFFPNAPKLESLYWCGFKLSFPAILPALLTVELAPGRHIDMLADLMAHAPGMVGAVLQLTHTLTNPLHIPSLRVLELSCPNPTYARGLRTPALVVARLKFTEPGPGLQNLDTLSTFIHRNCARLYHLKLSFAGDFNELAGVLKVCRRLHQLVLGDIGWSTSFAASFFNDMACRDESGEWICGRLEELTVHVVQLEGAVRTALINLANARRACVPDAERPLCPLRSLVVVRSHEDHGMSRRSNFVALNKKLQEILLSES